ncbi:unnamed protein product [Urochloa decumbens]|uniref:Uncharacterized protein n=1 Tax=Urochloa decumbens TaxID=240449 RepID=A0ABC9HE67_9POAL
MSPAATTAPSCPDATSATASMASDDPPFPDATKGGYHVLRIDGYSRTFNESSGVPSFQSGPFRAGGRTWRIGYYPNGTYDNHDFIAVYLLLADAVAEPVKIAFEFSILGPYQEPLEELPSRGWLEYTFSAPGSSYYGYEEFVTRKTLLEVQDLRDYDCLAVKVELRVVEDTILLPPSDMGNHLAGLLSSKEHTDVEFRVGDETFAAHRLLLEARSPMFTAKLLGRNNKEHKTTTVVQIDDMEPRVFKAMLSFIYTDTWPKMEGEEESAISQRLFVAADQYGLQRLKLMCESRLCNLIDSYSMEDILYLAEKHQSAALKEACFDYIGSTATLLPIREEFLQVRENQKLRFDRLVSLCSTITKDQISNVFENDWSSNNIEAIDITLDIE